ncbi:unnamed protein product, partial [Ectocarpus sp. 4 AP-2014]
LVIQTCFEVSITFVSSVFPWLHALARSAVLWNTLFPLHKRSKVVKHIDHPAKKQKAVKHIVHAEQNQRWCVFFEDNGRPANRVGGSESRKPACIPERGGFESAMRRTYAYLGPSVNYTR